MNGFVVTVMAIAIIASVSSLILKSMGFQGAPVAVCLFGVVIMSVIGTGLVSLGEDINALISVGQAGEYVKGTMKVIGVGYLSGICSDVCEALGEKTISGYVILAGRVEILLIVMPYFLKILKGSLELF